VTVATAALLKTAVSRFSFFRFPFSTFPDAVASGFDLNTVAFRSGAYDFHRSAAVVS
jgi:hypothetical protein